MTKIVRKELIEEMDAVTRFCYTLHGDEFREFCQKERGGKQSLEQLSMLVRSLTDLNPWRIILSKKTFLEMVNIIRESRTNFNEILEKLKNIFTQNELVSDDA